MQEACLCTLLCNSLQKSNLNSTRSLSEYNDKREFLSSSLKDATYVFMVCRTDLNIEQIKQKQVFSSRYSLRSYIVKYILGTFFELLRTYIHTAFNYTRY